MTAAQGARSGPVPPRPLTAPDPTGELVTRLVCRLDRAEQAVLFVVDSGREQQGRRVAGYAVAEAQRPQPIDLDRVTVLVPEAPDEFATSWLVGIDTAVTEVADQQGAAEAAEPCRREHETPRSVKLAPLDQVANQVAARAVNVDETPAWAGDLVLAVGVLLGIGDVQQAAELLDVEGCIAARDSPVEEVAREVHRVEARVEDVDPPSVEVGGVQEGAGSCAGKRQTLVDRTRLAGADLRLHRGWRWGNAGVPTGHQSSLGIEEEQPWAASGARVNGESGCAVEDLPGRSTARDGHDERGLLDRAAVDEAWVDRGLAGAVVGHPGGGRWAGGETPRIDQVWIGELGQAGQVGDEVGLPEDIARMGRARMRPGHRDRQRQ